MGTVIQRTLGSTPIQGTTSVCSISESQISVVLIRDERPKYDGYLASARSLSTDFDQPEVAR